MQPLWVFGYGSLIWKPGFTYEHRQKATLSGYHRSFCMHSIEYRGTPEAPGLVLALDAADAATCEGVAYQVAEADTAETLAYLRARELVTAAYQEVWVPLVLEDGGTATAVTYVVDRTHMQYAAGMSLEEQAAVIRRAEGPMGPNAEYLHNTVEALRGLALHDPDLEWLDARVRETSD